MKCKVEVYKHKDIKLYITEKKYVLHLQCLLVQLGNFKFLCKTLVRDGRCKSSEMPPFTTPMLSCILTLPSNLDLHKELVRSLYFVRSQ